MKIIRGTICILLKKSNNIVYMEHKQLYRHILEQVKDSDNHHPEYFKLFEYLTKINPPLI